MEFNWQTKDGLKLFAKEWSIENPKAVIALVHGFGEHIMRYDSMAKYYNTKGYAMIGFDHRGHGQSEGPRGHVENYDQFLDGIDILIESCKEKYPGIPVAIYGHSMGGNLTLNYMISRPKPEIKLIVTTGPWIRLTKEPPGILKFIVRLARKVAPKFTQDNKIGKYISRVQDEVDKYMNDPLVHGTMSFNFVHEMFLACNRLAQFKGALQNPILIFHGGDDLVTDPKASKAFADKVTSNVTYKSWDDLYHEIHNESNREQVYDEIIQWIDNKLKL